MYVATVSHHHDLVTCNYWTIGCAVVLPNTFQHWAGSVCTVPPHMSKLSLGPCWRSMDDRMTLLYMWCCHGKCWRFLEHHSKAYHAYIVLIWTQSRSSIKCFLCANQCIVIVVAYGMLVTNTSTAWHCGAHAMLWQLGGPSSWTHGGSCGQMICWFIQPMMRWPYDDVATMWHSHRSRWWDGYKVRIQDIEMATDLGEKMAT